MNKKIKLVCVLMMITCFLNSSVKVLAADNDVYTYTNDFFGDIQESPDAYQVLAVLDYQTLGLDKNFVNPQGLYVINNMIYIVDTGNNRILEVERDGDDFTLIRCIDSFKGDADPLTFNAPSDICVSEDGYMYICDTNNNRVVKLDKDLNYILSFTKPDNSSFDQSLSYIPKKVVVDSVGRAYVLATNVNRGLIKYENDGRFQGFVGATEAKYEWFDYIWKTFFSTEAQRSQQENFVPTEYDNICMDSDGFIYAVTTKFEENDVFDDAKPIRRLNSTGTDILIRNGNYDPVGDIYWDNDGTIVGPSKFSDITTLENDIYVAVDRVRGRIFGYDSQGNMLYAFGGYGNLAGNFRNPTALEHMGHDLLVLDSQDCSITFFSTTTYGELIYEGINEYQKGNYNQSAEVWRQVLRYNGNYDLAYVGIGRALLRQGEYKQAMEYFELVYDDINYGKAFKLYRKEWIEDHVVPIMIGLAVVIILPLSIGKVKKIKEEVDKACV